MRTLPARLFVRSGTREGGSLGVGGRFVAAILSLALGASAQAQFTWATNADNTIIITGYTGPGGDVTIPSAITGLPVTSIGYNAFYNCTSLTAVTIPGSVTSIAASAFENTGLTTVTIPASVTSVGTGAFAFCTSLTTITVDAQNASYSSVDGVLFDKSQTTLIEYPGGLNGSYKISNCVTSIGDGAFVGAGLTSITIPDSVTNIGTDTFDSCTSLTNVTIGDGVTSIGDSAFYYCGLDNISIPSSVTSIGRSAFCYSSLSSVTIPASVTSIGFTALFGSTLTNVTIGDGVSSIGAAAFSSCSLLTSVTIPTSVTYIGSNAFYDCYGLTSVSFPGSVTSIGDNTFGRCSSLTNITIANGVTVIGDAAFYDCSSLTNVTIPDSVSYISYVDGWGIGDPAFRGCTNLVNVFFKGDAPDAGDGVAWGAFYQDNKVTVYYLPGTGGWSSPFAGRPAVLWNPLIQTGDGSFGEQNGQFGFNITGTANIPIVVEACTDLANPVWTPLATLTLTNGSVYFSEPTQTNSPGRFYRISSP